MELVINLEKRSDRLIAFQKHHGDVERLIAVENKANPNRGCLESHLKAIRLAMARQADYLIIFEDDAVLRESRSRLHQLVAALEKADPSWQILLFSISYGAHLFYADQGKLDPTYSYFRVNYFFNGAYCMAISSKAFQEILEIGDKNTTDSSEIDTNVYSELCDQGKVYLTLPFLAETLSDQSDIRDYDTTDDREKIKWCEEVLLINSSLE